MGNHLKIKYFESILSEIFNITIKIAAELILASIYPDQFCRTNFTVSHTYVLFYFCSLQMLQK